MEKTGKNYKALQEHIKKLQRYSRATSSETSTTSSSSQGDRSRTPTVASDQSSCSANISHASSHNQSVEGDSSTYVNFAFVGLTIFTNTK